jgi:Domain of unknown function (DUF4214)
MAMTPMPVLNLVTFIDTRLITGPTGSLITDSGETVDLQAVLSDPSAGTTFGLTILKDGVPLTILPSYYSSQFTDTTVSIGLGQHSLTALATLDGSTPSAVSAALNLYALPQPVAGKVVADNTSIDFARLFGTGYQLGFLTDAKAIQLVDGVIGVGSTSTEAGLQRLYKGLLRRSGDATGLGYYDVQRSGGLSLAGVATQIMTGPEYTSLHGTQTDAEFVDSLYRNFFGRDTDSAGAASHLAQLTAGVKRSVVAETFANSVEAVQKLAGSTRQVLARDGIGTVINQVYQAGLNRTVDQGGLATYKALLSTGALPADLAATIAASSEFAELHGVQSNAAYVTGLYQSALSRTPDAGGLQAYAGQLSAGTATRADVLLAIATSPEAMARLPTSL